MTQIHGQLQFAASSLLMDRSGACHPVAATNTFMAPSGDPQPLPVCRCVDTCANREFAFASLGATLGSIVSLFLSTLLLNLPILASISVEDKGTLETSLASAVAAVVTLNVGCLRAGVVMCSLHGLLCISRRRVVWQRARDPILIGL